MTELGEAFCRKNAAHFGVRADTQVCCITARMFTMKAPRDNVLDMDHSFATEWVR